MPGRWKIGGCSIASTQAPSRAPRNPGPTTAIRLTLSSVHGSKEHHESGDDPEAEPDEQEPRLGAEPLVRVVAADQADHGREHHREADRGQLGERGPG